MRPETVKLTVRLPREDIEFARRYARANHLTVTEVIDRCLRRMRMLEPGDLSPELDEITGLVPADVDADQARLDHLQGKHGR